MDNASTSAWWVEEGLGLMAQRVVLVLLVRTLERACVRSYDCAAVCPRACTCAFASVKKEDVRY